MPRPTRYELPAVRRTIYIHPETSAALDRWCASGNGRTPGMWVDDLARRLLGFPSKPEAAISANPMPPHEWTAHPTMGRQCAHCHRPPKTANPSGCPERKP